MPLVFFLGVRCYRLVVRTLGSQSGNRGSIPLGTTKKCISLTIYYSFFIFSMPIIKSAKKRATLSETYRERNLGYKTRMMTMIKNIIKWVSEGNIDKAKHHFDEAQKSIDLAAKRNIIHKNNAARKKSRIATAIASGSQNS